VAYATRYSPWLGLLAVSAVGAWPPPQMGDNSLPPAKPTSTVSSYQDETAPMPAEGEGVHLHLHGETTGRAGLPRTPDWRPAAHQGGRDQGLTRKVIYLRQAV